MEYQVYEESTGEIIAWIDTSESKYICKNGYAIKAGNDLKVQETEADEGKRKLLHKADGHV